MGAAARQVWHGDGPELDQVGLQYHDIGCRACACRSTGRYGGRRLCYLLRTSSPGLWVWDGIWAWFMVLVLLYKVIDKKGLYLPSICKIILYEKISIIIIVSVHSIYL